MAENKVVQVCLKRYLDPDKDSGNRELDYMWEIAGDNIDTMYADGTLKVTSVLNSAISLYNKNGWEVTGIESGEPYYPGPVNRDRIYPYQFLLKREEKDSVCKDHVSLEKDTGEFQL